MAKDVSVFVEKLKAECRNQMPKRFDQIITSWHCDGAEINEQAERGRWLWQFVLSAAHNIQPIEYAFVYLVVNSHIVVRV